MCFGKGLIFSVAVASIAVPLTVTFADPASPATRAASADDERRQQFALESVAAAKMHGVQVKSAAELVHFSTTADMLVAELVSKDPPEDQHLILPNPAIVATLHAFKNSNGLTPDPSHRFSLILRDFSSGQTTLSYTTVSAIDGRVQISRDFEAATTAGSIQLIQDPPPLPGQEGNPDGPVRLLVERTVGATGQNDIDLRFAAKTFVELCHAHPAEIDQYLRPVLHDLGQEAALFGPDPKAIWQVLAEDFEPDAATAAKTNAIVGKLASDSFQERQNAAASLDSMGQLAAIELMKADRSKLTAEQNSGIDTFLAPFLPLAPDEAKRLGRDVAFLLNCQYSDEPALRHIAAARLARVLGHAAPVNPDADPETRAAEILKARGAILPPTTASAKPS